MDQAAAATSSCGIVFDPRVIQGLLTATAAFLGSFTAWYIARYIYPRQKKTDLQNDIRKEIRAGYTAYFDSVSSALQDMNLKKPAEKPYDRAVRFLKDATLINEKTAILGLLASERVFAEAAFLSRQTQDVLKAVSEKVSLAEIDQIPVSQRPEVGALIIDKIIDENYALLWKQFDKIRLAMREEAFNQLVLSGSKS